MLIRPHFGSTSPGNSKIGIDFLPTGIKELDTLLEGGLPRGKISEIVGDHSGGRTSLALSILAQSTRRGELVTYVDTFDFLDPRPATQAGVQLRQLLWIRCGDSVEKALKSADLLASSGRFGVLVLDLDSGGSFLRRKQTPILPSATWFRLQRSVRQTSSLLIILNRKSNAASAASTTILLRRCQVQWRPPLSHASDTTAKQALFLQGIWTEAHLLRGRHRGHVTFYRRF